MTRVSSSTGGSRYLIPEVGGKYAAAVVARHRDPPPTLRALSPEAATFAEEHFDKELARKYVEIRSSLHELPSMLSLVRRNAEISLSNSVAGTVTELESEVEALRAARAADAEELARLRGDNELLRVELAASRQDVVVLNATIDKHSAVLEGVEERAAAKARASVLAQLAEHPGATDAELIAGEALPEVEQQEGGPPLLETINRDAGDEGATKNGGMGPYLRRSSVSSPLRPSQRGHAMICDTPLDRTTYQPSANLGTSSVTGISFHRSSLPARSHSAGSTALACGTMSNGRGEREGNTLSAKISGRQNRSSSGSLVTLAKPATRVRPHSYWR
jgi:hypothetical protein